MAALTEDEILAMMDAPYDTEDDVLAAIDRLNEAEPTPLVLSAADVLRKVLEAIRQRGKPERKSFMGERPLYKNAVVRARRITALGLAHKRMEEMFERQWRRSMQEFQNRVLRRLREVMSRGSRDQ